MPSPEQIADTVNRYISLIAKGSADDLVALFADDATVEDPVGGEVHIGRQAIRGFYSAVENVERECELVTLRVAGNEAAFQFRLTVIAGESRMLIEKRGVHDPQSVRSIRITARRTLGLLTSVKPASAKTWTAPTCSSPQVISRPGWVRIA